MKGILYIFFYLSYFGMISASYEATVIVPVANLINQPFDCQNILILKKKYESWIPWQSKNDKTSCNRLHQLLFNERVTVLNDQNYQSQIEISQSYYLTNTIKTPQNIYWILSSYLMPLNSEKKALFDATIPPAVDYHNPLSVHNSHIITLSNRYYDPTLKMEFSPGTRFLLNDTQKEDNQYYQVTAICPSTLEKKRLKIPKKNCIGNKKNSFNEKKKEFVALLLEWVFKENKIIPYALGGCTISWYPEQLVKKMALQPNKLPLCTLVNGAQIQGVDCSSLVLRALQLVGIPYFYKNTFTLKEKLTPLNSNAKLEEGDLIWIPGHVMVIADLKKNKIIEARGYEHGYGKVHLIEINKVFKGINNFEELKKNFHEKKALYRLDSTGTVRDEFKEFYLFSLNQLV